MRACANNRRANKAFGRGNTAVIADKPLSCATGDSSTMPAARETS
jgi:hypothetical protein